MTRARLLCGTGLVAYGASPHHHGSSGPRVKFKSHVGGQVLTGNQPRFGYNVFNTFPRVIAREIPSNGIAGPV